MAEQAVVIVLPVPPTIVLRVRGGVSKPQHTEAQGTLQISGALVLGRFSFHLPEVIKTVSAVERQDLLISAVTAPSFITLKANVEFFVHKPASTRA